MKAPSETSFIHIWEVSFLILTTLVLSSVWVFASPTLPEEDGQRILHLNFPVIHGLENPTTLDDLSDYTYAHCKERIDTDRRLSLEEKKHLHSVMAIIEYRRGETEEAQYHLKEAKKSSFSDSDVASDLFTLSALLRIEDAVDLDKYPNEILLRQSFYSELNAMSKKEAREFAINRIEQWRLIPSHRQIVMAMNHDMLIDAQEEWIAEDLLIDIVAERCKLEIEAKCREIEIEVLYTWLHIHS